MMKVHGRRGFSQQKTRRRNTTNKASSGATMITGTMTHHANNGATYDDTGQGGNKLGLGGL